MSPVYTSLFAQISLSFCSNIVVILFGQKIFCPYEKQLYVIFFVIFLILQDVYCRVPVCKHDYVLLLNLSLANSHFRQTSSTKILRENPPAIDFTFGLAKICETLFSFIFPRTISPFLHKQHGTTEPSQSIAKWL